VIVGSTAAARNKLSVASVLTPLDEDGKCNHGHGPGERVSACGVSFLPCQTYPHMLELIHARHDLIEA
jgi:hypothetical protein